MLLSCQRQGSLHTASYLLVQKTMNQFWQLPVEIIAIKKQGMIGVLNKRHQLIKWEGIAYYEPVSCDPTPIFAFKCFQKVVRRLILPLALS